MNEKLLKALQLIKEECERTPCDWCPMCNEDGSCKIQVDVPCDWDLEKREE